MPMFPLRRPVVATSLLIAAALLVLAALQAPQARDSLLQWVPMNYFSSYAAVPATDGGSVIHAFTQKLIPVSESDSSDPSVAGAGLSSGYGYYRLQQRARFYKQRLAQLNHALHSRVMYAYMKPLLQRGFHRHAAASVALLRSELDALKAHVTALAQELDDKNQLSARMAGLQNQALAKMMARVSHLAALVHASARHRISNPIPKPLESTACERQACSSRDLKWMQQLSRALSLIQAQSIHQTQMMHHVTSLSHEVEMLRHRLRRRRHVRRSRNENHGLRGKAPAELSSRSSARLIASRGVKTSLAAAAAPARKQMLNKLLDRVDAVSAQSPGSPSLDGLYHEIHNLQRELSDLPSGPQKL
jgi:hypothetical protein